MPPPIRPRVQLHGEQTDGVISAIENNVPAGWPGPPLHHHDFDETFYVLEGELSARYLLVCTPAGFERYFAGVAAEHEGAEPPAWALGPIPEVTRVGPRIGEREEA